MLHALDRLFWIIGAQILSVLYGRHRVHANVANSADDGDITPASRLRNGAVAVWRKWQARRALQAQITAQRRQEQALAAQEAQRARASREEPEDLGDPALLRFNGLTFEEALRAGVIKPAEPRVSVTHEALRGAARGAASGGAQGLKVGGKIAAGIFIGMAKRHLR